VIPANLAGTGITDAGYNFQTPLEGPEPGSSAALNRGKDQLANRAGNTIELPLAFIVNRSASHSNSLQGVKRCAKRVVGHVRRCRRVTGGARSRDRRFALHFSRRRVRTDCRFLCIANHDFSRSPGAACRDRIAWSSVATVFFEKRQHTFRTISGPFGKETMACDIKRTTPMRRDKSLISICACARNSFDLAFVFPL
jgi:hypothetical protein